MSTAVPAAGRPASACAVAGPVVDEYWLGSREAVACLVRMEVLLSADMMMAVLFLVGHFTTAEDVADDGELWGFIAQVIERDSTGTRRTSHISLARPVGLGTAND
jgi:hypothetical protein